jgi:hypothetical protein
MNTKTLAALATVAVLAVLAAFWAASGRAPDSGAARTTDALIPALDDAVNDVTRVTLVKAGEQPVATLTRTEAGWGVAQKDGYPANIGKVRELLLGLADARLLEKKTSKPELYERIGVQDLSSKGATGIQVTLEGLAQSASMIIGNSDAQGDTYVRRVGEAQSWLASGDLSPAPETADWLDPTVLDIPADRVQSVVIRHPNGETLEVTKDSRDQANFTVVNVPEGRKLKSEGVANTLGDVLASLGLDDVTPVAKLDPAAHPGTTLELRTFDGMTIAAKAFELDDARYVHFGVSADPDQALHEADSAKPAPDAPPEDAAKSDAAASPEDEPDFEATREEAERLNARLDPWVFSIPQYRYDSLTMHVDELLKPLEGAAAAKPDVPAVPEETATTGVDPDAEPIDAGDRAAVPGPESEPPTPAEPAPERELETTSSPDEAPSGRIEPDQPASLVADPEPPQRIEPDQPASPQ